MFKPHTKEDKKKCNALTARAEELVKGITFDINLRAMFQPSLRVRFAERTDDGRKHYVVIKLRWSAIDVEGNSLYRRRGKRATLSGHMYLVEKDMKNPIHFYAKIRREMIEILVHEFDHGFLVDKKLYLNPHRNDHKIRKMRRAEFCG
jgi:hypothetical protein